MESNGMKQSPVVLSLVMEAPLWSRFAGSKPPNGVDRPAREKNAALLPLTTQGNPTHRSGDRLHTHTHKTPQLDVRSIIAQKKLSYESHDIHITFLAYETVNI